MKTRATRNRSHPIASLAIGLVTAVVAVAGVLLLTQRSTQAADIVVYKSPTCGCCAKWIDHLEEKGFSVEVHDRQDMNPVKARLGVPRHLQSCHSAQIGGYLVEGHVPADDIKRLLNEKPAIRGLAVPGMPMGSPGMEGPRKEPYDVLAFEADGRPSVYSSY